MSDQYRTARPPIQWGMASRPKPGENVLGDLYLVRPHFNGVLVAVADGIGHGSEAAAAAQRAISSLSGQPELSLIELMEAAHQGVMGSRGVVLGLASISYAKQTVSWTGVGNIEGVLVRGNKFPDQISLISKNGTVGAEMPTLDVFEYPLERGDVLLLSSDGIESGYAEKVFPKHAPQQIASEILERSYNGRDDALILVVKYIGRDPST